MCSVIHVLKVHELRVRVRARGDRPHSGGERCNHRGYIYSKYPQPRLIPEILAVGIFRACTAAGGRRVVHILCPTFSRTITANSVVDIILTILVHLSRREVDNYSVRSP